MDRPNEFHVVVFTDADNFEPEEPIKKAAAMDKWEGEDEDEDVKVDGRRRGRPPARSADGGGWRLVVSEAAGRCSVGGRGHVKRDRPVRGE